MGRREPTAPVTLRQQELWSLESWQQVLIWLVNQLSRQKTLTLWFSLFSPLKSSGLFQAGLASLPKGNEIAWFSVRVFTKRVCASCYSTSSLMWFKALWRLLGGDKLHTSLAGSFSRPAEEPAYILSSKRAKKEAGKAGTQRCFKDKALRRKRSHWFPALFLLDEWTQLFLSHLLLLCFPSPHISVRTLSAPTGSNCPHLSSYSNSPSCLLFQQYFPHDIPWIQVYVI